MAPARWSQAPPQPPPKSSPGKYPLVPSQRSEKGLSDRNSDTRWLVIEPNSLGSPAGSTPQLSLNREPQTLWT